MAVLVRSDALEALRCFDDGEFHAVVTDPPYGLSDHRPQDVADCLQAWLSGEEYRPKKRGFMGHSWDAWVPGPELWREVHRVLKPGAHLAVFAGTRTFDLMSLALRLAGFEYRDTFAWMYGQGFTKSHNVEKATGDAAWSGFGTAVKPSWEPVLLFRKPLEGTVAENVKKYGTGCLNIDGCRIPVPNGDTKTKFPVGDYGSRGMYGKDGERTGDPNPDGRWPPNVLLDEEAAAQLDQQTGLLTSGTGSKMKASAKGYAPNAYGKESRKVGHEMISYGDTGGASRFMYVSKASRKDRHLCADGKIRSEIENKHATVKPTDMLRWLCRLVGISPTNSTILDPFMGSGSTGVAATLEGFKFAGIDSDKTAFEIAKKRLR